MIGAALLGCVVALAAVVLWLRSGPDPGRFAELQQPRLTRLEAQRMLVVDATGDPNAVASGAFKTLFAAYYKVNGVSRMSRPPAPRVRWPRILDAPKAEWQGHYGLPLPADSTFDGAAQGAAIETWEYGDVAEILHVGPYSAEQPDIERLQRFVAAKNLVTIGDHEEEYVSGPGMFFAGDPAKYLTIIRLRVAPARLTEN